MRELLKGVSPFLLLSTLTERERYGYEIIRTLEKRCGGELTFRQGTIYPALHRLEAEGLVRGKWRRDEGRRRRYYRITARGKRDLARRGREWELFARGVDAIASEARHGRTVTT